MITAYTKYSDIELWNLLRKGDKKAFSVLYKRYSSDLIRLGFKLTSDNGIIQDTLQELFTDFWIKRNKLPEVKHVKIYLLKSFRYKLIRANTNAQKSGTYSLEGIVKLMSHTMQANDAAAIERKKELRKKLQALPERQREVIYLRYFQNLKNDEIAEIIGVKYQSVSNLLQRALTSLKKKLVSKDTL